MKRLGTKLGIFTFIYFQDGQFRIKIQTLFTLSFLMKSRNLNEQSIASCFDSRKTVNSNIIIVKVNFMLWKNFHFEFNQFKFFFVY